MSILREAFVQDRATWTGLVEKYDLDVYYQYDYVALECKAADTPEMYIYSHSRGTLLYPYVYCRIGETCYFDVVTAYGYGGPVFFGEWESEQVADARSVFCRLVQVPFNYHRDDPVPSVTGQRTSRPNLGRRLQGCETNHLGRPPTLSDAAAVRH